MFMVWNFIRKWLFGASFHPPAQHIPTFDTLMLAGFTVFLSSLTFLVLTSLGYENPGLISLPFLWITRNIKHVGFYLSSGSRNATGSGDSLFAKRAEWINVSRITSIKVLDD
jgi:hypothetical protein